MFNNKKNGKIVVQGIEELRDLIPEFLEHRKQETKEILEELEAGNFDSIARKGHSLLGLGGGYGFDEISDLGRLIEQAALEGEAGTVRSHTERLISYLEMVEVVYD